MNSTEVLTRHALTVRFDDLPEPVVRAAKVFILDTLGVGVAGKNAPYAEEIFQTAKTWGTSDSAYVFGRRALLPTAGAAFVNGFQIHCQEFDCVHEPAVVHPMATIFAALFAEAQAQGGVHGRDLITAVTVAVDVAAGLGVAAKSGIRFFRPATAGIFGASLGVARLRRFSLRQALDALGYALAFASGTMQAHVEGKPALPVQIGNAARSAIAACDLAGAGMPGPNDVFEGPFGYLTLFETEADLAPVLETLGKDWRIAEVSHKPFPTGRAAQGGIVAVQRLREQGVTAKTLDTLVLTAPPLIHRLVGRPYKDDMTASYARLCFAYTGALALQSGRVGLDDFTKERLRDPAIKDIAQKIKIVEDGSTDPAAFTPQIAVATLKNGPQLCAEVSRLYGSPDDPLSYAAHLQKFRDCLAFGLDGAQSGRAEAMIDFVENLELKTDMTSLAQLAAGV